MSIEKLKELAEEFAQDAQMMESIAKSYMAGGMVGQFDILWHEGAVYRVCAYRLREAIRELAEK